ncbi:ultra-long-chain fatty acid omega-hydroxylase-like [Ptychodera flava]|uniref:ultra-long-chain fatty acid omega-hydroxylase-like n=1 Tax=Ptychodera flava TaxID=63121 RepID=UPI00396A448D
MIMDSVLDFFYSFADVGAWSEISRQIIPRWETFTIVFAFTAILLALQLLLVVVKLLKMRWASTEAVKAFPTIEMYRHPILGHLELITINQEETMQIASDITDAYPYAIPLWLGPFHCALVCHHPDTVQPLLATAEPKDELMYGLAKSWLGDGLLISKGKKWTRNRKLLTPGFHFDILKPYVKVFNDSTRAMLQKWNSTWQNGPLEMFSNISLMTLDSLLMCIFSQQSHCQTEENMHPYIRGVYKLSDLVTKRVSFPPYYSDAIFHMTPDGFKYRKALTEVHGYSKKVIKDRRRILKEGKTDTSRKHVDFLDILLTARDEDGKGLTDQEIQEEVDTFMFEGHDTTASSISWCLYNLARHPRYQEKCREEIDGVLDGKDEEELSWDDLGKLPYLTMCIKENMRLNPGLPIIARRTEHPLHLPKLKVTIPADQLIVVNIMGLHHNPQFWPDSYIYDPDRFLPERCKDRPPHCYLPFSAGPRNCIGQNFAMNEMKVCISLILRNFVLSIDEDVTVRRLFNIVLRTENGLHVSVQPRKRNQIK